MRNGDLLPQEVLKRFQGTGLDRDVLFRWAKRGDLIKTTRLEGGRGGNDTYLYPETELARIAVLVWGHELGLPPDLAVRFGSLADASLMQANPDALLERFRHLFQAIQDIPSIALTGEGRDDLEQIAIIASRFVPSECFAVFLAEAAGGAFHPPVRLRVAAQSPGPFEPAIIELNDAAIGLTGGLAKRAEPVALHGVTLRKHELLRGGPPRHLASGQTCSLMILPVLDHHQRLRGCLKFENKRGVDGRVLEHAFYDPFDQAIGRVLARQVMLALEHQAIREATTDLMRHSYKQLKLSEYMSIVLRHAIRLVDGDYGDVFWRGDNEKFTVLSQHGGSTFKKGAEPKSPSVARTVADSRKPELIPDVSVVPFYANCRPSVKSEVTVPVMRGSRCVAVLNVESERSAAFDSHDMSTLQYLADHAIPEVEAVYRRDEFYTSVEEILGAMDKQRYEEVVVLILRGLKSSGFDRARVFEYDPKKQSFVCACSVGAKEKDGRYARVEIPVSNCRYAQMTVDDAKKSPITAQIRVPDGALNPYCKPLGKDPNLPWVVYPLVRGKALLGYIAADNHVTGEPFTPTLLGNLPLFGKLAARAMAQNRKRTART